MRNFTSEQIQQQFDKLPLEVQTAIGSPEVRNKIQTLSKRYTLMIDQAGELIDEVGLILLGLEKSSTFVEHISKRLNISSKTALAIARDVNHDIFDSIKKYMKDSEIENAPQSNNVQTEKSPEITTLERVGNFSIERESGDDGSGVPGKGTHWKEVTAADRGKILAGVEDPPSSSWSNSQENRKSEIHPEPIVDYVLENPIGQKERTHAVQVPDNLPVVEEVEIDKKSESRPPAVTRTGPDPYHEPTA